MSVIIGIDPHKASHMAVAIDDDEQSLGVLEVRGGSTADAAVVGVGRAVRVRSGRGRSSPPAGSGSCCPSSSSPPVNTSSTCRRRCRLGCGCSGRRRRRRTTVTTRCRPRSRGCATAACGASPAMDHTTILRLLVGRYDDLVALRTQAACRLHASLRELVAGGAPRRLSADRAAKLLRTVRPVDPVEIERKRLAVELLADVRRLDRDLVAIKTRIATAVDGVEHDAARAARCRADRRRR